MNIDIIILYNLSRNILSRVTRTDEISVSVKERSVRCIEEVV